MVKPSRGVGTLILTLIVAVLSWTWLVVRVVLEFIGASTLLDDSKNAESLAIATLRWFFDQPWWVAALFASVVTSLLLYLTWVNANAGHLAEETVRNSRKAYDFWRAYERRSRILAVISELTLIKREIDSVWSQITMIARETDVNADIERGCINDLPGVVENANIFINGISYELCNIDFKGIKENSKYYPPPSSQCTGVLIDINRYLGLHRIYQSVTSRISNATDQLRKAEREISLID